MIKKYQGRSSSQSSPQQSSVQYLLGHGTINDLLKAKELSEQLSRYHWDYYYELARQRNAIKDEITKTLIKSSTNAFGFEKWQRAVKYKYGLHPFCTMGSLSFIGGRFNFGHEVNSELPSFPALYLAKNKDTALQEHLGQESTNSSAKLTSREAALTNPSSETIVSVSGKLDKVFDLTNSHNLKDFVKLIKNFTLPKTLISSAKKLNLQGPTVIKTPNACFKTLTDPVWRNLPTNFDIPANSQIFGHLIYTAHHAFSASWC